METAAYQHMHIYLVTINRIATNYLLSKREAPRFPSAPIALKTVEQVLRLRSSEYVLFHCLSHIYNLVIRKFLIMVAAKPEGQKSTLYSMCLHIFHYKALHASYNILIAIKPIVTHSIEGPHKKQVENLPYFHIIADNLYFQIKNTAKRGPLMEGPLLTHQYF